MSSEQPSDESERTWNLNEIGAMASRFFAYGSAIGIVIGIMIGIGIALLVGAV